MKNEIPNPIVAAMAETIKVLVYDDRAHRRKAVRQALAQDPPHLGSTSGHRNFNLNHRVFVRNELPHGARNIFKSLKINLPMQVLQVAKSSENL